jgi:hypothetical protein
MAAVASGAVGAALVLASAGEVAWRSTEVSPDSSGTTSVASSGKT